MIIECPHCKARVDGKEKGAVELTAEHIGVPSKYVLLECNSCYSALLGYMEVEQDERGEWDWGTAVRRWPAPESDIDRTIPEIARISLVEAKQCFKANVFSACAVMCGKAVEGVCVHFDPKTKSLATGLAKLKKDGHIDDRLFSWGEVLRKSRNLGAHATTERVSKDDARDLLDFSIAICEYVFVLSAKFERFEARRSKAKS